MNMRAPEMKLPQTFPTQDAEKGDRLRWRYLAVSLFGFLFVSMGIVNDNQLLVQYQSQTRKLEVEDQLSQHPTKENIEGKEDDIATSSRRLLKEYQAIEQDDKDLIKKDESLTQGYPIKCSPWETDMDPWWQMHPDWEPYNENETHTCFRPIQHEERAAFFREVYQSQYHGMDCSQVRTRHITGVGYAAAVGYMCGGFYSAFRQGYPFQVTKVRESMRWLYAPPLDPSPGTNRSWAACPSQDNFCYFLPISNCQREWGRSEDSVSRKYARREVRDNPVRGEQYMWLKSYLTRPRQEVRRRLAELIQQEAPVLDPSTPCVWIHVRRTDAMSEFRNLRNFYGLNEYLERGNVSAGDNILLLTDDQTTIEEAHLLYPEYKWNYWNRTRYRGRQKRNSHIPSDDQAREMLIILAELQLAGQCTKGVHGTSNMVGMLQAAMALEHGMANIELISIDGDLKKERVPAEEFLKDLEAKLKAARNAVLA
ncbi:expressed unknown protein [Seminavis robusta]|uniref:Uncharacterized protein n=1 Tax=Seminavis robusta TaxID=568900 RepID=A0A9N8HUP8_9STRA|nr:expressed unknown protein [Seminavis robusta]|eukprot:Sro1411_g270400.1 n/a (481) ;mRNA; r:19099-20631